jgi:hypothetical protein
MNYQELEHKVFDWGVERGIVQNAKPMGQAIKCLEEVTELIDSTSNASSASAAACGQPW